MVLWWFERGLFTRGFRNPKVNIGEIGIPGQNNAEGEIHGQDEPVVHFNMPDAELSGHGQETVKFQQSRHRDFPKAIPWRDNHVVEQLNGPRQVFSTCRVTLIFGQPDQGSIRQNQCQVPVGLGLFAPQFEGLFKHPDAVIKSAPPTEAMGQNAQKRRVFEIQLGDIIQDPQGTISLPVAQKEVGAIQVEAGGLSVCLPLLKVSSIMIFSPGIFERRKIGRIRIPKFDPDRGRRFPF